MIGNHAYCPPKLFALGRRLPPSEVLLEDHKPLARSVDEADQHAPLAHAELGSWRAELIMATEHRGDGAAEPTSTHLDGEGIVTEEEIADTARNPVSHRFALPGKQVCGHNIYQSDALRTLVIDGELVHFTPTEYKLLLPLLDDPMKPIPFRHLTERVLNRELDRDARRLLDKHVDRIRSKLRPFAVNVHCVARYGYMLLPEL